MSLQSSLQMIQKQISLTWTKALLLITAFSPTPSYETMQVAEKSVPAALSS